MTARFENGLSKAECRCWIASPERREQKREWGWPMRQPAVTRRRAEAVTDIVRASTDRRDPEAWPVLASGSNIEETDFATVPVVAVQPTDRDDGASRSTAAVIPVEIAGSPRHP